MGVELYETFKFTNDGDEKVLAEVLKKYEEHAKIHKNLTVDRYIFFESNQKENQTMEDYIKELTIKCNDCDFDKDANIKDSLLKGQIISGIRDKRLQEKLLRLDNTKSTLSNVITTCRTHEVSIDCSGKLDSENKSVDRINVKGNRQYNSERKDYRRNGNGNGNGNERPNNYRSSAPSAQQSRSYINNCAYCGSTHARGQCPAYGKSCTHCGRNNHFEKVCRQKRDIPNRSVNQITDNNPDHEQTDYIQECSNMFVRQIERNNKSKSDTWSTTVILQKEITINIKVDCGADVSMLNINQYNKLRNSPNLSKCDVSYTAYNKTPIPVYGKCTLETKNTKCNMSAMIEFVVADYESVLSGDHSIQLGLLKKLFKITAIPNYIKPEIFDGIGCIDGEVKIHLKEGAIPKIHAPRKIPHTLLDRLKKELDRMIEMDIIYPIKEPTDWVSSLVIVEKPNGQLRICLDPKDLNGAIKRQHYPLPTTEDIFDKMAGATIFSKLDAASGYWQIKVDKESSKLLCFNTPFGRFAFSRLPFGIVSASEIFQQKIEEILEGIRGQANNQDDIIIWGATQEEHDHRLKVVLDTLYEAGIRLNREKCEFNKSELLFLGHIISKEGVKPDPEKVTAIKNIRLPQNKHDVQKILGMINYVGKFIPNLSETTAPLRKLIEKDTEFKLTDDHHKCLDVIKDHLCKAPVLQIFDRDKPIKVSSDSSEYGLGAVLLQLHEKDWLPVSYASRSLNSTERRYAQIEKECLSIVFATTRFHHYVYGRRFICETDHKPLETLLKKTIPEVPARIQRMMLVLIRYPDLIVKYVPGTQLHLADGLSRISKGKLSSQAEIEDIEYQVHMITNSHPISEAKLSDFKNATETDKILIALKATIQNGWPNEYRNVDDLICQYWQHRDVLTHENGLLYKGEKLIVPESMRRLVLENIHEGHLGITKCTLRGKTYFFWPSMTNDIKNKIQSCSTCQQYRNCQPKEPNLSRTVDTPWHTVGCDIFHFGTNHYLIVTDYYSSYPEVILINRGPAHGTSYAMIQAMKSIFSRQGIPENVITDGGPQFRSREFKDFANRWEFEHEMSDPYYPRGNSKAERSVQTVKSLIRKAESSKSCIEEAVLAYRSSPLQDCGKSPSELLYNRTIRSKINNHVQQPKGQIQRSYDQKYANQHSRSLPPLTKNDHVRVRGSSSWDKQAMVVGNYKKNERSYVVQMEDGSIHRRNRQHLRKTFEHRFEPMIDHLDDDSYSDIDESNIDLNEVNDDNSIINDTVNNVVEQAQSYASVVINGRVNNTNLFISPGQFNVNDFRRVSERKNKGKIDLFKPQEK